MANAPIHLSEIPRDPEVAAFLARGEEGSGGYVVPATPKPVLQGGEAVSA